MNVDPFLVEKFMTAHEHNVEINIAETCVNPFTLGAFLKIVGEEDFFYNYKDTKLTYGFIPGSLELRKGLADLYENLGPENILMAGGAIGANFLVFYTLVEPQDTVISIFPSYQQLYSVAKSFGADVKLLKLKRKENWVPNINELKKLVDDKTKLIVINNPHNPTGSLIDESLLSEICSIAEDAGAYILSDEAYRNLYINPKDFVPSVVDLSKKAIATGSFSKIFSLTGLRLGWIASNREIIREIEDRRDYVTISNGMIDDSLASLAVKNKEKIFERNIQIIRNNHKFLSEWIEDEPLIDWVPAKAGSIAFLRHKLGLSSNDFCIKLINEKGTFLVPGSCFGMDNYLRIGYGCEPSVLHEGLSRLKDFLDKYREQV